MKTARLCTCVLFRLQMLRSVVVVQGGIVGSTRTCLSLLPSHISKLGYEANILAVFSPLEIHCSAREKTLQHTVVFFVCLW